MSSKITQDQLRALAEAAGYTYRTRGGKGAFMCKPHPDWNSDKAVFWCMADMVQIDLIDGLWGKNRWRPHKDISQAFEVVDGILASTEYVEDQFDLRNCIDKWDADFWYTDEPSEPTEGHGATRQLAIAYAALKLLDAAGVPNANDQPK